MKIIREIQNAVDGKYRIADDEKNDKHRAKNGNGFREDESRVVRGLVEVGLAIPQRHEPKKKRP